MSTLSGSAPRGAVFLRIATDPVLALWLGFGDIDVPANSLDAGGQIYQSLGLVVGMPELEQLLNGVAQRVEFVVSGVPAAAAQIAQQEVPDVIGVAVNVGLCAMDDDWQIDGDLHWLWDGASDMLTIDIQGQADGSQSFALRLSVATANAARARAAYAHWTDAQQQKRYPGDLFLTRIPAGEKTKRWPGG